MSSEQALADSGEDPAFLPPIPIPITFHNRTVEAVFHIMTGAEETALRVRAAAATPPLDPIMEEGFLRISYSLLSWNGKHLPSDFEARLSYVRSWPTPLIDTVLAHYTTLAFLLLASPDALETLFASYTPDAVSP